MNINKIRKFNGLSKMMSDYEILKNRHEEIEDKILNKYKLR